MKLTKRDFMLLLHGLVTSVAVANATNNGKGKGVEDLTKYKEAERFVHSVHNDRPAIPFEEMDELFTKLVHTARTIDLDIENQDLASLEPSSEYLH